MRVQEPGRQYADIETGEVVDFVAVPRREKVSGGDPWLMVIQNAAERIADEAWPAGDYQVMWKLVGRLDWENFLLLDMSSLAKDMGRTRESVSRAVARLVDRHVLLKGPRIGRSASYRLDPSFGWKGTPKGRSALQGEISRRGWQVVDGGGDSSGQPDAETLPGL